MRLPAESSRNFGNICSFDSSSDTIMRPVTHIIFDMDGLLLDTEKINKRSVSEVVAKFGKTYSPDLCFRILGIPEMDGAKMVVDELNLPISIGEYIHMVREIKSKVMSDVHVLPGVSRLLQHLYKNNVPFAVATSSARSNFEVKTSKHQSLFSLFNHIVSGASDPEVKNGKPAPDIFLTCASRFSDKPHPNKCLVFEDSPNGVRGAIDAGMQVVMVPDSLLPKDLCSQATVVLDSLEHFIPESFGLPPF